ncbi:MAG: alpha/beta fold hydrolase [Sphingomicrobium sp.]
MPNDSRPAPAKTAKWKARNWTSRDGLKLYFRDYAGSTERPPLLCLHGLTRNSRDFEAFADRHAGRFRVIAVDFRGRGMSQRDPQPGRYLPVTYAADILQLLDELAIDRALFVGTSLGGLVTMLVAGIQPQRIAGAILNDVGPELDDRGLDRIRSYVGKPIRFSNWDQAADYIAAINRNLPASYEPDDWRRAAGRLCREDGDAIVFDYDMAIAEPFNQPNEAAAFDMWPLYRRLGQGPLLIVRAENSDLLSRVTAKAMLDAAPGAQLATVPGVGHAPELTEPAAVAAIDDFLARFAS